MLKYIYIPSSLKYMRENYNVCRPTLLRDVLAVPAESQKNENTAISWISLKERIPFLLFTRRHKTYLLFLQCKKVHHFPRNKKYVIIESLTVFTRYHKGSGLIAFPDYLCCSTTRRSSSHV